MINNKNIYFNICFRLMTNTNQTKTNNQTTVLSHYRWKIYIWKIKNFRPHQVTRRSFALPEKPTLSGRLTSTTARQHHTGHDWTTVMVGGQRRQTVAAGGWWQVTPSWWQVFVFSPSFPHGPRIPSRDVGGFIHGRFFIQYISPLFLCGFLVRCLLLSGERKCFLAGTCTAHIYYLF